MAPHPDALALSSAMWTDEWWYRVSSNDDVVPPMLTSSRTDSARQAIVVGKQALLTCLKYKNICGEAIDQQEEASEDEEEIAQKKHLIGSVVKAPDGSLQLFADHRSHIGSNHQGCCGRSFVQVKKKAKSKPKGKQQISQNTQWPNFVPFSLKTTATQLVQVRIKQEEIKEKHKRDRICNKTYSTYAIQHKFREQYVSLKIGVKGKDIVKEKPLPIQEKTKQIKMSTPKQKIRKQREEEYIDTSKIILRVAPMITLNDFEADRTSYEEDDDEDQEPGSEAAKKKKKKKLKKKAKKIVHGDRWFDEMIHFKSKKDELVGCYESNNQRANLLQMNNIWSSKDKEKGWIHSDAIDYLTTDLRGRSALTVYWYKQP
jgi:hypothetical protein